MKLAILSDIHGNLIALQAVLQELEESPCERTLFLGDAVLFGPQPSEALDLLRTLPNLTGILGNTDEWLFTPPSTADIKNERDQLTYDRAIWARQQLDGAGLDFIRAFRPTAEIPLDGRVSLFAYHGNPSTAWQGIYPTTPETELERLFARHPQTLLIGGHTHMQMTRPYQEKMLINPGSVGMPLIQMNDHKYRPPYAEYAVLTVDNGSIDLSLRRALIDVNAVTAAARSSSLPGKESWAQEWED